MGKKIKVDGMLLDVHPEKNDFSAALTVKIKDPKAIEELEQRAQAIYELHPEFGDVREQANNFHITICRFFIPLEKLTEFKTLIQEMDSKLNQTFNLELQGNACFGPDPHYKFPVALVKPNLELQELHQQFSAKLEKIGIKSITHKEGFNPHISLFLTPISINTQSFEVLKTNTCNFKTSSTEISHKNNQSQFLVLTPTNIDAIHEQHNAPPSRKEEKRSSLEQHGLYTQASPLIPKDEIEKSSCCNIL